MSTIRVTVWRDRTIREYAEQEIEGINPASFSPEAAARSLRQTADEQDLWDTCDSSGGWDEISPAGWQVISDDPTLLRVEGGP